MPTLYNFQRQAVDDCLNNNKHFMILQTGAGKTACSISLAKEITVNSSLSRVLVVTTASKAKTCFPAGVKVKTPDGEKNIEDMEEGDIVYSYQRKLGVRESRVAGLVKYNTDKKLYRIDFGRSGSIIATEDHLFYMGGGKYKRADKIKKGAYVWHIGEEPQGSDGKVSQTESKASLLAMQQRNTDTDKDAERQLVEKKEDVLLGQMWKTSEVAGEGEGLSTEVQTAPLKRSAMSCVSKASAISRDEEEPKELLLQNREDILQQGVQQESSAGRDNELQTNEKRTCRMGEDESQHLCEKEYTHEPSADRVAKDIGRRTRICGRDKEELRTNRFSVPKEESGNRDRRKIPQREESNNDRQEKRWRIRRVRVENIQVLRQDTSRENTVYCINVENDHNFFANGLLVHNCDWQTEAREWGGENWYNSLSSFEVVSWHSLKKWWDKNFDKGLKDYYIIFDEVAKSKSGISSQMGKTFLSMTKQTTNWVGLTATPGDTWMEFYPYFVACGLIKNKTEFKRRFVQEMWVGFPRIVGYAHEGILENMWASISTAPDTSQMNRELPAQTHKVIEFNKPAMYDKTLKTLANPDGELLDTTGALCAELRRQCFTKDKRQWVADFVEGVESGVVIFYNFTQTGDLLEEICTKALGGAGRIWRIDGKHHEIPTAETVGKKDVVLCQWQAGAEALNLQFLHYWISVESTYSYSTAIQARGRIRRIGQAEPQFYYYLKCPNTIEDAVYKALKNKSDFASSAWCIAQGLNLKGE